MLAAEEARDLATEEAAQEAPRLRLGRIRRKMPEAVQTVGPVQAIRQRGQRTVPR